MLAFADPEQVEAAIAAGLVARTPRTDARSACAYRVQDAARKTRSRAVAGALQATRGEEGQGAWNGAGSVEFG